MIRPEESLEYHAAGRPGKIEVRATTRCLTRRDMRLAYLPGSAAPAREILRDPSAAWRYTARGNLVALVTDGSSVPGLGAVGPAAAKPMQEGMAVLLKRLADIDAFDLELDACDSDRFVETVRAFSPGFGGINLEHLAAPAGLEIYERLERSLDIPVFHENLWSTAIVAAAAVINALDLVEKRIDAIRVVVSGAGTVGTGCIRLLGALGVPPENLLVYDVHGLIHPDRSDLHEYQRLFARADPARELPEGLRGADLFLGASAGGILTGEMVRTMNAWPIVFALSNPDPEIGWEEATGCRQDVLVATSLDRFPNAVVDLLSVPYVLRGALDVQARKITEGMMLAAARALAELAREEIVEEVERAYGEEQLRFGPGYLLPKPIDPRILVRESSAVARQAVEEGVARRPVEPEEYEQNLTARLGTGRETLRGLTVTARKANLRVVFPEGANETILRACSVLVDEAIARPILLGPEAAIRATIERLRLDLGGVPIVDPARSPRLEHYAEEYFRRRARRGVLREAARERLLRPELFAAHMVDGGDADMMIAGATHHYAGSLRTILEAVGPAPGVRRISSHYLVLRPKGGLILADCAVNVDPTEEELAEIALLAAKSARALGLEPRVAMLSFSNFGSSDHPFARKVRRAAELARERAPGLVIDGEMQLATALEGDLRRRHFPFSTLDEDANVLVFPDLDSGNLALHLLEKVGGALSIGPVLMGTRKPVHLLQYGLSVSDVVHLATVGAVEAAALSREDDERG
jgi:malate dehydrogenase (oxaloacetate-decarboxylating)(NADP+)